LKIFNKQVPQAWSLGGFINIKILAGEVKISA